MRAVKDSRQRSAVVLLMSLLLAACDLRSPSQLLDHHAFQWQELAVRWNQEIPSMVARLGDGTIRWDDTFIRRTHGGGYVVSGEGVVTPVTASSLQEALQVIQVDESEVMEWMSLLAQAELVAIIRLEEGVIELALKGLIDDGFVCVLEPGKLAKYRDAARAGTLKGLLREFYHVRDHWFYYVD